MISPTDTTAVSAPASAVRHSRAHALLRRLRRSRKHSGDEQFARTKSRKFAADASASPLPGCCWPLLNRSRHQRATHRAVDGKSTQRTRSVKQVRFDTQPSVSATPKVMRKKSMLSAKGLRLGDAANSARSAYYSAYSSFSRLGPDSPKGFAEEDSASTVASDVHDAAPVEAACAGSEVQKSCPCQMAPHSGFDSAIPIITPPGVEAGSYDELLLHARAMAGEWVTMIDRSDSLEPQMVHVGIGKMKRMVMNRLAIPFTAELKENDTLLDCWISTPVGEKHTTASLVGKETEDKDGDLGDWKATTQMVDYSCKWYCEGKTVRAMQQTRVNPKLGVAYETRTVLPDAAEGKVLLYNVTIHPPNGGALIAVDRVLKVNQK